jgi:ATP-dependent Clp protease ATP-binding subunit ClpC
MKENERGRTSEPLLSFLSPEHLKEPPITADVLRVLVLANDEARKLHHKRTGPEHILLGLIHEGSESSKALHAVGLTYEKAREYVIQNADFVKIEPKEKPILSKLLDAILVMFRQRPFSNDAWLLMHASIEEAQNMGSSETTSEHILLALLNQTDADIENNLHSFGLDSRALREVILKRQREEAEQATD